MPEATPICPRALLHLGKRSAVDQALSRLARTGKLMRICQGIYMRPIKTRSGARAPAIEKVILELEKLWGVTIVSNGSSAAKHLQLTSQLRASSALLTSGPSRRLQLGTYQVELRHAPSWQLYAPRRKTGNIIRALSWLGSKEIDDVLAKLIPALSPKELEELSDARAIMPRWMAEPLSKWLAYD